MTMWNGMVMSVGGIIFVPYLYALLFLLLCVVSLCRVIGVGVWFSHFLREGCFWGFSLCLLSSVSVDVISKVRILNKMIYNYCLK